MKRTIARREGRVVPFRGEKEGTYASAAMSLGVELRCGAVAVGRTYLLPPLSSGGALVVLNDYSVSTSLLIEPDMQISRIRLPDKTSPPSLWRATPSAVSEHSSELIGCPISRSFTTYCVCLELRSLPSTGITRLQRSDQPLRHPKAPGLSLTGFRLVVADHALGLPVFRALSLCRQAVATTPAQRLGTLFRSFAPSRVSLPQYGSRVGLRIVLFEACSAFTGVTACTGGLSPYFVTRYPKASATSLPP